ncbi:MAG: dienelactone hydrolase family protein [Candidatus Rokubacteria bacterium]|nr:dienelactone hydrolase family protein [Candidatus Rokubacteria bacterium]
MAQAVRIPRAGGDIGGLLAVPDGPGPFPGAVVIPTVFALNDFARHVVDHLAGDGFAALAVNIFDHPGVPEDPFKRPGSQADSRVLGDLDAGLEMLQGHPKVTGQPISAWGYCIGGRFAMLWPTYQPSLAAAASFHGFPDNDTSNPNTPTTPTERVRNLRCPVIAFFGEADTLVPMSQVEAYREALGKHAKESEVHTYPGCDHGWTNPERPAYNKVAAEDCWHKAVESLRKRIGAKK